MRVLLIDNTIDPVSWGSREIRRFAAAVPGATFYTRRAPQGDLPTSPEGFDRIILSGSKTSAMEDGPWIEQLLEFVRRAVSSGKPYLGICYGHQTLVRALGGSHCVRLADEPEFGWTRIELTEEAGKAKTGLLGGLPKAFHSFSSHFDEVGELPKEFRHLARSKDCEVQACQLGSRPVYGIQFHPERNLAEGEASLRNRLKLPMPKRLINAREGSRLFDSKIGETIFKNFLNL